MRKIKSLSVGTPIAYEWNRKSELSGIGKKEVNEVFLTKDGFTGDGVADLKHHGGTERAVCVYPYEHYIQWEEEFEKVLVPSSMGENLCVTNMLEKDVYIGDVYQLGDAIVQVSQGRVPCSKISKFNHINLLLKRIIDTNYTGYFFRVLQEGNVSNKGKLILLDRTQESVSVYFANQTYFHDKGNKEAIEKILMTNGLAEAWKKELNKLLIK